MPSRGKRKRDCSTEPDPSIQDKEGTSKDSSGTLADSITSPSTCTDDEQKSDTCPTSSVATAVVQAEGSTSQCAAAKGQVADDKEESVKDRSSSPPRLTALAKEKGREEIVLNPSTSDPPLSLEDPVILQPVALDTEIVRRYPGSVVRRLLTLANFCSTETNSFAIENVPLTYTWGEKRALSSNTPFICDKGNQPTTVWLLGSVLESTLASVDAGTKMHGIAITPITQGTGDELKHLLAKLKAPPSRMIGDWSDIRATCVVKSINDGGQKRPLPFTAVYDARQQFSNLKEEMSALPPAQLNPEDIVLVESRIRRWSTKKDPSEKGWTEWGVKLDLLSVSLLHDAIQPPQAVIHKPKTPFRI